MSQSHTVAFTDAQGVDQCERFSLDTENGRRSFLALVRQLTQLGITYTVQEYK